MRKIIIPHRLLENLFAVLAFSRLLAVDSTFADPQTESWLTTYSGQYARVYPSAAAKSSGQSVTTWSNGRLLQSLPAYCGVQEVLSSSNWVYVLTTGLASYTMGPWYMDLSKTRAFPNLPVNQKMIYRMPRVQSTSNSLAPRQRMGEIGMFVDGVRMFDATDAFSYSTSNGRDANPMAGIGQGDRIWNRDAWVNERATFDSGYAHQQNTGRYHYHANPIALRYLLEDHVDYDATNGTYRERAALPVKHSPIIGWMQDGYPLYGPYGYANPTNAAGSVRRMVSGYAARNGESGTDNLSVSGRVTLPAWAGRVLHRSTILFASQFGPQVNHTYPIDHYIEDYAYLGDCGRRQGIDFDLDECNGRWCVTPEFPNATYAYFSTITSEGTPAYPYNMGRTYRGNPTGELVASISETVVTNFLGGAESPVGKIVSNWKDNTVTLSWNAIEGGIYLVESKSGSSAWTTNAVAIPAIRNHAKAAITNAGSSRDFDVKRTSLGRFDSVKRLGSGILSVVPSSAKRGTSVDLTVNLDWSFDPPPQRAPINRIGIGNLSGADNYHASRTQVTTRIQIPDSAPAGAQTVKVVFPGPPGNPSEIVTYALTNGFTIN